MENTENEISGLIHQIDQVRAEFIELVIDTDPKVEICPGWRIKEVIGHITAWEKVIDKAESNDHAQKHD